MPDIPAEAVQAAAPDLYEVIWLAAFGHLEQVQAGVWASDLRATVLGSSGLVVVSAEDLRLTVAIAMAAVEMTTQNPEAREMLKRLLAALPERSTDA